MVDIKELKKLVKYLRKEGITEFKANGMELKLGPVVEKLKKYKDNKGNDVSEQVNIDTDYPTHEELLFMSAGGPPPKDS